MRPDQDVELLGRVQIMQRRRALGLKRFRSRPIPVRFRRRLTPFEDRVAIEGLGRLRLGKKLRKVGKVVKKVVKSKAFKIAAIGAAAYFTGGAALRFAKPMLSKLAASRALSRIGKGAGSVLAARAGAQQPEAYQASAYDYGSSSMFPGLTTSYGGGGGGSGSYGGGSYYEPGADEGEAPEEGETPAPAPMLAGMGGTLPLIAAGIGLVVLASRSRGGRRRRR